MSATGKTPNYNLAIYRDYDITSYLTDFNGNMEAIDTALKDISDAVTGGGSPIGTAEDFVATAITPMTIRNNQSGSTTALLTIANVVPNQYNASVFLQADTTTLTADDIYGEVFIALDGTPTPYIVKLTKEALPDTWSFSVPINMTQKGYVTLEVRLVTDVENSLVITQSAMSLQKLKV